ncbi:Protein DHHC-9 [Aphelenchoides avenae]|nr:Protein DHHC-9 [Aphelenchus avenae]
MAPRCRCMRLFCRALHRRITGCIDNGCLFYYLDLIFRKFLGRFLVVFIYAILSFMIFVIFAIVIPFESLHKPTWVIVLLIVFAAYLVINIVYHYRKASMTPPGRPPRSTEPPICFRCQNTKPPGTHHCGICDTCVVDMDHHCVWINQCVGARNHRHFLQFIGFLTLGCFTFVTAGYPTLYYNYVKPSAETVFCQADIDAWPWRDYLCSDGGEFVMACIFFCYFLCAIVFFLVGGLFWWNVVLISTGKTYIDFLQGEKTRNFIWRIVWPMANQNFSLHWKRFLGLSRNRTFVRHILLPSAHISGRYVTDETDFEGTAIV